MSVHAKLSPSGASGWMNCSGWESNSSGSSSFSRLGTAAHTLAEMALTQKKDASEFIGTKIVVEQDTYIVDDDMALHVQVYLDTVRGIPGELFIEQALRIDQITDEDGAKGTSDAVIISNDEIIVVDLKYGQGVRVDAEENEQLQMYGLAAYDVFRMTHHLKRIRMIIVQPRLNHISEWGIPLDELEEFRLRAELASKDRAKGVTKLTPGDKQCRWCAKKSNCSALAMFVQEQTLIDFDDLSKPVPMPKTGEDLGKKMKALDLIEVWIKSIRDAVEGELINGREVPGYKLVAGRQGNRKWRDEQEVEVVFKTLKLPDELVYKKSIISPTEGEKRLKAAAPATWAAIQELITRSEGSPSVAPVSDKRPPLTLKTVADDFEDLSGGGRTK